MHRKRAVSEDLESSGGKLAGDCSREKAADSRTETLIEDKNDPVLEDSLHHTLEEWASQQDEDAYGKLYLSYLKLLVSGFAFFPEKNFLHLAIGTCYDAVQKISLKKKCFAINPAPSSKRGI